MPTNWSAIEPPSISGVGRSGEGAGDQRPLHIRELDFEQIGDGRRDVAAHDGAELGSALHTGPGRQEERAVVRMSRPVAVIAAIARRPYVLVAARLVAERVAPRGFEYELADHRIRVGRREAEGSIVRHAPDAGHTLEGSQLGLQIPDDRLAVARIEDVDVAGAVVGDEASPALDDPSLGVDLQEPELSQTHVHPDL